MRRNNRILKSASRRLINKPGFVITGNKLPTTNNSSSKISRMTMMRKMKWRRSSRSSKNKTKIYKMS